MGLWKLVQRQMVSWMVYDKTWALTQSLEEKGRTLLEGRPRATVWNPQKDTALRAQATAKLISAAG